MPERIHAWLNTVHGWSINSFIKMEKSFVALFNQLEQQIKHTYAMKELLIKIQQQACNAECLESSRKHTQKDQTPHYQQVYADDQLVTVRHAMLIMNVSRGTIHTLRKEGKLTSLYKKRNVWLIKEEVLRLKETYSKLKGKI